MTKLSVDRALLKAKSYAKKGDVEEALKLYQAVIRAFPKNKRAQQGLAALNKPQPSTLTQGPPLEAINQLINLYNQGQLIPVVKQTQALIEQYPKGFVIWNILGAANKGLGRIQAASEAFKKVTELNPTYAEGFNNLGVTLQDQGELDDAIASYNKALSLKPDYTEAYNNMGNALKDQGKLDEAIEAFKKALSLRPNYPEAHNNMSIALQVQGKLDEAIASYNKALSLKPDYADAYNNLGSALHDQGSLDEAIIAYKEALSLKPDHAEAYNNMGNILKDQGKLDEAIETYRRALSLKSDYPEAYNNMSITLQEQGRLDEAIASYKKALSLKPDYAEAHRHLSSLIKYKPDDTQIALVAELIRRPDLKNEDKCHLHYTLAKMKEDLGDIRAACDNYVAGGKLRQRLIRYDFKRDKQNFHQIKAEASRIKEFVLDKPTGDATNTPIFILGMPRSGTTLVEQIISRHSQVHGAGELSLLRRFGDRISRGIDDISTDALLKVRESYSRELNKVSENRPFVTDKMPHNFLYIGIINKVLPEAKIIHVKRDPAATCWSNFKHYFSQNGLGYSYNLNDTANYYELYQDLMEFWDQLYGSKVYHLDYDRLTIDQEIETKKLIEYLELGWEDDCLSPQENKRNVRTSSQQQVRAKVYKGSSQAWGKFEPYLNGVFDKLFA